jgi:hypothetical protein
MKKIVMGIVAILMLVLSSTLVLSASAKTGPNFMGFSDCPKTVKVGQTFTVTVYADVHSKIDTCAIDKMSFVPAGVISYKSVKKGNLFGGSLAWMTPNDKNSYAVINNVKGMAYPIVWANMPAVNNVKKTFAVITFTAMKVGTVTILITAGGTAGLGIDPGTTKYPGVIKVVK